MTHIGDQPTKIADEGREETATTERFERPDLARPRGNQDVEEIDVERGQEKIGRISGN